MTDSSLAGIARLAKEADEFVSVIVSEGRPRHWASWQGFVPWRALVTNKTRGQVDLEKRQRSKRKFASQKRRSRARRPASVRRNKRWRLRRRVRWLVRRPPSQG